MDRSLVFYMFLGAVSRKDATKDLRDSSDSLIEQDRLVLKREDLVAFRPRTWR